MAARPDVSSTQQPSTLSGQADNGGALLQELSQAMERDARLYPAPMQA